MTWPFAENSARADEVGFAEGQFTNEDGAGTDNAIVADGDIAFDHGEGADFNILA